MVPSHDSRSSWQPGRPLEADVLAANITPRHGMHPAVDDSHQPVEPPAPSLRLDRVGVHGATSKTLSPLVSTSARVGYGNTTDAIGSGEAEGTPDAPDRPPLDVNGQGVECW